MSNFCKMLREGSPNGLQKKFQTCKVSTNYISFRTTCSGDCVNINCFAKYLNFAENMSKTDFGKLIKVFIKSQNLDILQT